MAILNIFKKNKKPEKKPAFAKASAGEEKPAPAVAAPPKLKKISGQAYGILKKPRVTEKATDLTSKNQYIFEVFPASNKNQIKKAVEDIYGVDVVGVKIINIHRKKRRLGKIEGWKSGYKKAIVRIKEGQKIEVLSR